MTRRIIGFLRQCGYTMAAACRRPTRVPRRTYAPIEYRRVACTAAAVALAGSLLVLGVGAAADSGAPARTGERSVVSLVRPHVVVLKKKRLMHLFDGETLVRTYPIDLGAAPVGPKRLDSDGRTPEGRFRVVVKNDASRYHRFLGIDYPDVGAARWGLSRGLLSAGEWSSICAAVAAGHCPEWGTPLGGGVGIHGGRKGTDWTAGCIAVADEHVEELFAVLRVGDPVEILP